jgi:hypothetical protein
MKRFNYIDENNAEAIDLIRLFEYAFNHADLTDDEIIIGIKKLEEYITIKQKNDRIN